MRAMKKLKVGVLLAIALVAVTWFLILVTDTRVLLSERKVEPGQAFDVEGYGNVGDDSQARLVCRYFNGRRILTRVFGYSPSNQFGRDSCPFLLQD